MLDIIYRHLELAWHRLQISSEFSWKLKGAILCQAVKEPLDVSEFLPLFLTDLVWSVWSLHVPSCGSTGLKVNLNPSSPSSTDGFRNTLNVDFACSTEWSFEESNWKDGDGDEVRFPKLLGVVGGAGTASRLCSFYKSPSLVGLAVQTCCGSIICPPQSQPTLE